MFFPNSSRYQFPGPKTGLIVLSGIIFVFFIDVYMQERQELKRMLELFKSIHRLPGSPAENRKFIENLKTELASFDVSSILSINHGRKNIV